LYHSLTYLLFLVIAGGIFRLLKGEGRRLYLGAVSLIFIGWLDVTALAVTLALTVITYLLSLWVKPGRLIPLLVGILAPVGTLVLFKYLGFLSGIISGLLELLSGKAGLFGIGRIAVPLGLSYLVFKYISYLIDIYWGLIRRCSFLDLLCYGSLFSTFVAGPMERFEHFQPQLHAPALRPLKADLVPAFQRIAFGLFKKLVLADWLAYLVTPVWDAPASFSPFVRALALFGYSLRIYFDFAGYSDIAIGASRWLGFEIGENFADPYSAVNIGQFWRRWHISLSDWIRDYLFFPLSRLSQAKLWLGFGVPLTAMAICGLWHGAGWNFVLWGIWHGLGISVYQAWAKGRKKRKGRGKSPAKPLRVYLATSANFLFVSLGWVFFVGSGAELLRGMLSPLVLLFSLLVAPLIIGLHKLVGERVLTRIAPGVLAFYALLLTILLYCGMNTGFIYAKF